MKRPTPTHRLPKLSLGLVSALLLAACGGPKPSPTPPPDPVTPVAHGRSVEVNEGTPEAITLAGEAGPDDALTFTIVEPPANGTLSGTPPALTYVPNPNYLGADAFTFTVSTGDRTSAPATIEIEVLNAPFYTITRGGGDAPTSKLYHTNGKGETALVGDTGHALITIKADPTNGRLYAATRVLDVEGGCNSCLVTLDRDTGAATVVGPFDHDGDPLTEYGAVASIAFTSGGTLYGFSEHSDDLVTIDKATGSVTAMESDLSSWAHGMWTDANDTIWFLNGGGDVYTLNAATGEATQIHAWDVLAESYGTDPELEFALRGDRNPLTGSYWGVPPANEADLPAGLHRVEINLEVARYIDSPSIVVPELAHNLAFAR